MQTINFKTPVDEALSEQFRMRKLQVLNWGTFSGLHEIPISEEGFLFIGSSGSGKSTLLDAISALLVPPKWTDFNAAARDAERSGKDRNLLSYIRGAYAEQKDASSNLIATQFLRPSSTWSALALTYQNQIGQTYVIAQIFAIKGNTNNSADVKRHFIITETPFDIKSLEGFDFDIRKTKQALGESVYFTNEFRPYSERFCRHFGIASDKAIRLLHKTQSAKNLGDLNEFLREFMLDKPETFSAAERLVKEFAELSEAHKSVVDARKQIEILRPASIDNDQLNLNLQARLELEKLRSLIDSYKADLNTRLLQTKVDALDLDMQHKSILIEETKQEYTEAAAQLDRLQTLYTNAGGGQIIQLEQDWHAQKQTHNHRLAKLESVQNVCRELEWQICTTSEEFTTQKAKARELAESCASATKNLQSKLQFKSSEHMQCQKQLDEINQEIKSLKSNPSNIPAQMLELRKTIASSLKIKEEDLPFAGELIEVLPHEAEWQGAIERVLHSFALSILVDEKHYNKVNNFVNSNNLRGRLVYHLTSEFQKNQRQAMSFDLLPGKVDIKNCPSKKWLETELRQRFDYRCVSSMTQFKDSERALTKEGLIKSGKSRHEKDDRRKIDDRRNWVLGFDNKAKLKLFETAAKDLKAVIASCQEDIKQLEADSERTITRAMTSQQLSNVQWIEIDVVSAARKLKEIDDALKLAKSQGKSLEKLEKQKDAQLKTKNNLELALIERQSDFKTLKEQRAKCERQLDALSKAKLEPLKSDQKDQLGLWFALLGQEINLENLDESARKTERNITNDVTSYDKTINAAQRRIEVQFQKFVNDYPELCSNFDATLRSADGFFAMLTRLEADGLPAFEERFFQMLETQSNQNLAALNTHLAQAKKIIQEGVDLVNESLKETNFNKGTYLFIRLTEKHIEAVADFKRDVHEAVSDAWNNNREQAEHKFGLLQAIVGKLGSDDPESKRWREQVLDVRQHVEFMGQELDSKGNEVEIYRSGAGKSGGQRQKLATTCLAAALHYQLSRSGDGVPSYAAIVLDEAFDKADNEFTTLAMDIFKSLHFQMIVATPLKSVMTLEPFIGGACFVSIEDRKDSKIFMVEYDHENQKLDMGDSLA